MGRPTLSKLDLSGGCYPMELDEGAKDIWTINTSQRLFKICRLHQGLKNSSSIFQHCIESALKGIKGVVMFQHNVLVYGDPSTSKEGIEPNPKHVAKNKKKAKAPTNNKQLESLVGQRNLENSIRH